MKTDKYVKKAEAYFLDGYNCAQAVAAAFADVVGLPTETVLKMACPFGGGFARLRYVCGAVSGMGLIAGLVYGTEKPDCKVEMYPKTRALSEAFQKQYGSILCAELLNGTVTHNDSALPEARTAEYYKKRSCLDCVKSAAAILTEDLEAHEYI